MNVNVVNPHVTQSIQKANDLWPAITEELRFLGIPTGRVGIESRRSFIETRGGKVEYERRPHEVPAPAVLCHN